MVSEHSAIISRIQQLLNGEKQLLSLLILMAVNLKWRIIHRHKMWPLKQYDNFAFLNFPINEYLGRELTGDLFHNCLFLFS